MTIHLNQNLLYMIAIGFFIGLIARALMPGRDNFGCILTTGLGIAGAVAAGLIGRELGLYRLGQPAGFIASALGAILILALLRLVSKR